MQRIAVAESTRQRHVRNARRGVAMVEGAIVLGVFLTIVLGTLDLGLALLRQNVVTEGARRVAREAIVHGSLAGPRRSIWGPNPVWWSPAYGTIGGKRRGAKNGAPASSEIAAVIQPVLITAEDRLTWVYIDWPDGDNQLGQRVRVQVYYWHRSLNPFLSGRYRLLQSRSVMRIAH